jgi:hypothetical protein
MALLGRKGRKIMHPARSVVNSQEMLDCIACMRQEPEKNIVWENSHGI